MKLSEKEQKICDKYSAYDEHGFVRCGECPLVLNKHYCICKANVNENELELWGGIE